MTEDTAPYSFRPATFTDLNLLRGWLAAPHVAEWWDDGDPFDAADLARPHVRPWIVGLRGRPIAYIQDYAIHAWGEHHLGALPPGARGIDQFIGPAGMLGQRHGSAFIAHHMRRLFAEGAPAIGTDPHPANARAIAAYTGLGFRPLGPAVATEWGTVLPMGVFAPPAPPAVAC